MAYITSVQETADLIINYIEEHGWTQRAYQNSKGEVCIFGAMRNIPSYKRGKYIQWDPLVTCLGNLVPYKDIIGYNDTPGRTKEDIINLLKRAKETCNG